MIRSFVIGALMLPGAASWAADGDFGIGPIITYEGQVQCWDGHQSYTVNLGTYGTKEEAAAAYRGAAKVLWGEFART